MVQRRNRDEEFYEAMPGTMRGVRVRREREVDNAEQPEHLSPLAWIGLAAVIVLGLILLGAINANRSQQNSAGANPSTGAGAQSNSAAQPAGNAGSGGSPGAAKNMP